MPQVVHAPTERRLVFGRGQGGLPGVIPDPAIGDRRQFAIAESGEEAAARARAVAMQVRAQDPGQWRRHWNLAPLASGARLELPVVATCAVVGPLSAYFGCH